jgi:hypothetical protein
MVLVAALAAVAQEGGPSMPVEPAEDSYAKLLEGKKLEDGVGFPGVVAVGEALGDVTARLGRGREDMAWPFWRFYDKGPWQLTVAIVLDPTSMVGRVQGVIIAGKGAPPTSKGIRIGDTVAALKKAYGEPAPFDRALVGLEHKGKKRTRLDFERKRQTESTVDDPPEFKDALWFPSGKLLVAVFQDKVAKIAVVFEESRLPIFLKDKKEVPANPFVAIDPKVTEPTHVEEKGGRDFLVPPPPELTPFQGEGFRAMVPKGWTKDGDFWRDPGSAESVGIKVMRGSKEETPEFVLSTVLESGGMKNLVPEAQRKPDAAFLKMIGADDAFCASTWTAEKGKNGAPLVTWFLMAAKGERRFLVTVSRTHHPTSLKEGRMAVRAAGSPDGEALARGVMRGLRIAP